MRFRDVLTLVLLAPVPSAWAQGPSPKAVPSASPVPVAAESRAPAALAHLEWRMVVAHRKVFDRLGSKENIPSYSQAPRLASRLLDLMSAVDDAYAAPTEPQGAYAAKLEGQLGEAKTVYQALIDGPFAALNEAFVKGQLPGLVKP